MKEKYFQKKKKNKNGTQPESIKYRNTGLNSSVYDGSLK